MSDPLLHMPMPTDFEELCAVADSVALEETGAEMWVRLKRQRSGQFDPFNPELDDELEF